MGMFDYIDYRGPLPASRNKAKIRQAISEDRPQSKSVRLWEDPAFRHRAYDDGCVTITVDAAGNMRDPDMKLMDWTGTLNFYGACRRIKWFEFNADVKAGRVVAISEVKP